MAGISKEVKDEILSKIKSGEKVMALSKQYGVSEKTIYNWLRLGTEDKISLIEHNKLKRENIELKAIIGALTISTDTS
ncbi:transposase [Candidatus Roizmanbacteria bacterium]|nr:transposase [Candidatus Roizmanbacteria bacterium]